MKIQYINNLRAFACYLVILTHSAMPAISESYGMFMVFFAIIASPSSELFVMISSSLLAPTKEGMIFFYKKRFSKLLGPFLFWSLIILIIKYFQNKISLNELFYDLALFPIKPVTGVYWFVYAICGLYLVIPIISPWLNICKRKELLFVLALWSITLFLPYLNIFLDDSIYNPKGDYYFILTYFGGFIGYLFLGVYLRKYPILYLNKVKAFSSILFILFLGLLPIICGYIFNRNLLILSRENLSITSAFFVIAIFTFFQNFKLPHYMEYVLNIIAKHSYGIYLIHIIIIRDIVWRFLENNRIFHPVIETPLISIVSLLICLAIVRVLSFLPKSKYIVGV
ncbi:acyltransferase [Yeosuana marina]|uniref:acyltransferase n=1 Tax=Yeosuana marina TaxID=1565536 RepID=UPI00141E1047|nr:acyltransferase [Yeosuana marina]